MSPSVSLTTNNWGRSNVSPMWVIHAGTKTQKHQWNTSNHTHTDTHTHLYLYYYCQNWLHGPHSGGEPAEGNKTGGPVGSGDTSLISPNALPPQCSRRTHLWACKTHEMWEEGYGLWVTASECPSRTLGHRIPHLHLASSRWLIKLHRHTHTTHTHTHVHTHTSCVVHAVIA